MFCAAVQGEQRPPARPAARSTDSPLLAGGGQSESASSDQVKPQKVKAVTSSLPNLNL